MENVKIEINMNELLELAERCGNYYTDNVALLNENTELKAQIKVLKEAILEKCFYDSENDKNVTSFYFKEDFARFMACGITLDEVKKFVNAKIQERESEKVHD